MNNRFSRLSALILFPLALFGCAVSAQSAGEAIGSEQELLSASMCPDGVPANLTPAADQRLFFVLRGDGVQIYECKAVGNAFAWTFIAPEANLLNPGEEVVGIHYAGPTWESEDGSRVKGAKLASAPAPIPGAIPWLLLGAVSHNGDGKMSGVTSIQRLSTTGGVAPPVGCDAAHEGDVANVPYTANYFFYRTNQGGGDNPQCGG